MNTGLTSEQMRMFVEIVQMAAILDDAMEKYITEYCSICEDEKTIRDILRKIKGAVRN